MAVNVPNPGNYVIDLGAHIVALRNAYQIVINDLKYLNAMGGASFLTATPPNGIGMAAADAPAVVAAVGNLGNIPALQTALDNSQGLWGGRST